MAGPYFAPFFLSLSLSPSLRVILAGSQTHHSYRREREREESHETPPPPPPPPLTNQRSPRTLRIVLYWLTANPEREMSFIDTPLLPCMSFTLGLCLCREKHFTCSLLFLCLLLKGHRLMDLALAGQQIARCTLASGEHVTLQQHQLLPRDLAVIFSRLSSHWL